MPLSRRDFIIGTAAGTATMSIPGFLSACALRGVPISSGGDLVPDNPFAEWFGVDPAMLARILATLTGRGADAADAYFQYSRTHWITLEDGIVSRAASQIDEGVGLRVVVGDQTGYAFTEDLEEEAILGAARTASAIAHAGPATPPSSFGVQPHEEHYLLDVPWEAVGIGEKLPLLQRLEERTRALEPRVAKVTISFADTEERILLANMQGHVHTDVRPSTRLRCAVTATRGDTTVANSADFAGRQGIGWYDKRRLDDLAKKAIDRTVRLFDARRPPAGEMPVVLAAGASGILLHEAIGHGMEADFNRKGISIFADQIGKQVAPDFVTIVDSGILDHERGSLNFDDEGVPCQRTVLVENGKLATFMHDGISARHYGLPSTGSGRRESFRHAPMPRMRCTYMEDGPHDKDEIIASVDRGIVAETFTNGQVRIGAGDFTFYIKNGWMIEGGKITAPIKDCNIIGNGPEALRRVTMAAGDSTMDSGGWTCGKDGQSVPVSQGLPSVLVSKMTVGGEDA